MKLLYLADIRFPMERANGIQTIETCHALARAGVEVELCVRRTDARPAARCLEFYGLREHPNLELRRFSVSRPGTPLGQLTFAAKGMWRALRGRADALYTRDLLLADIALRLSFCHRLPVIYEAHTSAAVFSEEASRLYSDQPAASERKLRRLARRERRVYGGASRVVTITEALRRYLEAHYRPQAPIAVIPDGTRRTATIPPLREGAEGEPFRIVYIGQLYPWKGVDTLLQAMRELPRAELVVIGGLPPEPDLDRARALARELGVDERVTFRGFIPPGRLEDERLQADVFVIPLADSATSRHFTSPLKLFEAMAAGRPIVASDLPSLREVLTDEVNALLVPPGDPSALARALRRVSADPCLSARLALRAGEDVRNYTWEERARKITALLRELRTEQSRGRTPP